MRKFCRILKENDIGDMGIGAMIVFIAMVLVAGIAASVLIQTANRLEIQAMTTGQETTQEVSSGIGVEEITGQRGCLNLTPAASIPPHAQYWATNNSLINITIGIAARSGSNDIDLSTTVVELSNSADKFILKYGGTLIATAAINANGVFASPAYGSAPWINTTANTFGIIVLEDADQSCQAGNPVINRGDHVLLTINTAESFGGLTERTNIWGLIIPEQGAPGIFGFTTPASYSNTIFALY